MDQRENFLKRLDVKQEVGKTDYNLIQRKGYIDNTGKPGTIRSKIKSGLKVKIVQKQHQKTGELTEGIVKDILTNSQNHHRGIKVRLTSGIVGRIQEVIEE